MKDFVSYYLRGLVYGIAFFTIVAIAFGFFLFVATHPLIGVPILVLVVMPLLFGAINEGE